MLRLTAAFLLVQSVWFCAADRAHATTTVEVVATEPSGELVTLGSNQNFYLHLRYRSDGPVQIWARPYFRGEPADAGSNPSRVYPAGGGEALGWFFLFEPGTRVDEVRISAGDGSLDGTPVVAVYPVRINGGARSTSSQAAPEWVARLNALDAAAQKADYERRMNAPVSAGDTILATGFMLVMFAAGVLGLAAPAWGLWRWSGGWRIAAGVPAAIMGLVVLRILVETAADPTSHNLWPFEILMAGAFSVVIVAVMVVARRITGASRTS